MGERQRGRETDGRKMRKEGREREREREREGKGREVKRERR